MKKSALQENLDRTLARMEAQTGLRPGRSTLRCHSVMLGALTGAEMDFTQVRLKRREQLQLEEQHGIRRIDLYVSRPFLGTKPSTRQVLDILQTSEELSFDAVLMSGRVTEGDVSGNHVVAAVADNNQFYGVVDSLSPNAYVVCPDTGQAADHVDSRFNMGGPFLWGVVPDAVGRFLVNTSVGSDSVLVL